MIDSKVEAQLRSKRDELQQAGELHSEAVASDYRRRFNEHFGPSVLAGLDGETLLHLMHDNLSRDSMVYWLEYKNDDDFRERWFGGIGGRSALKFRFYHRREDGRWITGTNTDQREISEAEAIGLARSHRDQILAIVKLLESFPEGASDDLSLSLQKDIEKAAPDIGRAAFVHKYMALAFPTKLDDYHSVEWQSFHLKKLLVVPPGDGLYSPAGRYASLARELGWPIHQLTQTCNALNGRPHRYWRVGTSDGRATRNRWALMRDGNQVAIGWAALGDLSGSKDDAATKEKIRKLMAAAYPNDSRYVGKAVQEVLSFAAKAQAGDLVIACEGGTVLGVAEIAEGGYRYSTEGGTDFPHRLPVKWLDFTEWTIPNAAILNQRSFVAADKDSANVIAIERRLLEVAPPPDGPFEDGNSPPTPLAPWVARIDAVLDRKRQVILYGPPGTGKTFWAEQAACELAARKLRNPLTADRRARRRQPGPARVQRISQ